MRRDGRFGRGAGIAVLLLACAGPAGAQSPEDRYIADRDRAIRQFDKVKLDDAVTSAEQRARDSLEKQMLAIVGPLAVPGYGPAKLNLSTLFKGDMGLGTLDGLVLEADGRKAQIIVTTRTLLTRWLREHRNWWNDNPMPQQPDAAFRTEAFYTQAVNTDAAIVRFAGIPLGVADQPVVAMLASRTQDAMPRAAGEVFVAAVRGGRAFIAIKALEPPLAIEACTAPRAAAETKLEAAAQRSERTRERIEAEFKRCFAARAPKEPRFAEAVKLARALYEAMPAR